MLPEVKPAQEENHSCELAGPAAAPPLPAVRGGRGGPQRPGREVLSLPAGGLLLRAFLPAPGGHLPPAGRILLAVPAPRDTGVSASGPAL